MSGGSHDNTSTPGAANSSQALGQDDASITKDAIKRALAKFGGRLPACKLTCLFPAIRRRLGDVRVAAFIKQFQDEFDLLGEEQNLIIALKGGSAQFDSQDKVNDVHAAVASVTIPHNMAADARDDLLLAVRQCLFKKLDSDGARSMQTMFVPVRYLIREKAINKRLANYVYTNPVSRYFMFHEVAETAIDSPQFIFRNDAQAWYATMGLHFLDFLEEHFVVDRGGHPPAGDRSDLYNIADNNPCEEHRGKFPCVCCADVTLPDSASDFVADDSALVARIEVLLQKSRSVPLATMGYDKMVRKHLAARPLRAWLQERPEVVTDGRWILKAGSDESGKNTGVFYLSLSAGPPENEATCADFAFNLSKDLGVLATDKTQDSCNHGNKENEPFADKSRSSARDLIVPTFTAIPEKLDTETRAQRRRRKKHERLDLQKQTAPSAFLDPRELEFLGRGSGVAIINKPCGVSTEAVIGAFTIHQKLEFCEQMFHKDGVDREFPLDDDDFETFKSIYEPVSVSRLDKQTSGCLVVGVGSDGGTVLTEQFKERTCHKLYFVLVEGHVQTGGLIDKKIKITSGSEQFKSFVSPHGKPSMTKYDPVRVFKVQMDGDAADSFCQYYTLLHAIPLTGRTHQIRCHMNSIGHPVVGDYKYNRRSAHRAARFCDRLFLHCAEMGVCDLDGKSVNAASRLPGNLARALDFLNVQSSEVDRNND